jgi:WD40 repeat protein
MPDNPTADVCPYKGLQPYTEQDQTIFFGRDRDQQVIISNLYAASLTILYGASGVGKSSVLLAGAVPMLKQEPNVSVIVFRNWQNPNFLNQIKQEAAASLPDPAAIDPSLPLDEFLAQIDRTRHGSTFIVFDQFEEYFLYNPNNDDPLGFEAGLASAVNRRDVGTNFLLSIREDGLSRLDRFQGRIPQLMNNMLRLDHLDLQGAREAIVKPLERYNRDHADGKITIEDALVDTLLVNLRAGELNLELVGRGRLQQSGPTGANVRIATPVLQIVLTRLWEEERRENSKAIRLATLDRLGGPENIARSHLNEHMEMLSEAERDKASELLWYLVTPTGAKIAQDPSALAAWTGLAEPEVVSLLNKLSSPEMRILRAINVPGQPARYEIFHDVLGRAVQAWRARRRLIRERRRVRKLVGGIAFLLVVAAILIGTVVAVNTTRKNELQIEKANGLATIAYVNRDHPQLRLYLAIQAVKVRRTPETEKELRLALETPVRKTLLHEGPVRSAVYSPDGKLIATACEDNTAEIWDTDKWTSTVITHDKEVMNVGFSPDGKFMATACKDKMVRVFTVGDWKMADAAVLQGHTGPVRSVAFNNEGSLLVTGSEDNSARVWQRTGASWTLLKGLIGHSGFVQTAAFSHDGKLIVTASRDKTIRIWEVGTWRLLAILEDVNVVRGAVFSPDDKSIVSGNENCEIKIWKQDGTKWKLDRDIPDQEPCDKTNFSYQQGYIDAVNFSADGRLLVTASRDRTICIWDVATWTRQASLVAHSQEVYYAAFSPDAKYVVSGSEDGTAIVWEPFAKTQSGASIDDLLAIAEARPTIDLTADERQKYRLEETEK